MKLASVRSQDPRNRNGEIVVVSHDNQWASRVDPQICVSLLEAVENWMDVSPHLEQISESLNQGTAKAPFRLDLGQCIAPLPIRAWILRWKRFSLACRAGSQSQGR